MLALSIRQPWAWLILHAGKDIENRDWPTKVRGRVLIHAAKGMTRDEYEDGIGFAQAIAYEAGRILHAPTIELPRGGIVGSVEIATLPSTAAVAGISRSRASGVANGSAAAAHGCAGSMGFGPCVSFHGG